MAIVKQLIKTALEQKKGEMEDANRRLQDAKAQLDEAKATANRVGNELQELTDWIAANSASVPQA
jgi:predicted  nucleic acid-binding Zn-ribbon protein